MNDQPNIGHLIMDATTARDAVHIAIVPVVAGQTLPPGSHVGKLADGTFGTCDESLGIVDPYLRMNVSKGDRFYLFLYPGTITSLRHVWTHPVFKARIPDSNL